MEMLQAMSKWIDRLRGYIQEFYKKQEEKLEEEENSNKKGE